MAIYSFVTSNRVLVLGLQSHVKNRMKFGRSWSHYFIIENSNSLFDVRIWKCPCSLVATCLNSNRKFRMRFSHFIENDFQFWCMRCVIEKQNVSERKTLMENIKCWHCHICVWIFELSNCFVNLSNMHIFIKYDIFEFSKFYVFLISIPLSSLAQILAVHWITLHSHRKCRNMSNSGLHDKNGLKFWPHCQNWKFSKKKEKVIELNVLLPIEWFWWNVEYIFQGLKKLWNSSINKMKNGKNPIAPTSMIPIECMEKAWKASFVCDLNYARRENVSKNTVATVFYCRVQKNEKYYLKQ